MPDPATDLQRSKLHSGRNVLFCLLLAMMAVLVSASPASAAEASAAIQECVIQTSEDAQNPTAGTEQGTNGQIIGSAATQFQGLAAEGAVPGLTAAFQALDLSTSPTVDPNQVQQGGDVNRWFGFQYGAMVQVGLWIMVPMLMISIIHAVAKGSLQLLVRSVLIYLPISVIGSVIAVQIVQMLINIADAMSTLFLREMNGNLIPFVCGVQAGFYEHGKIWIVSAFLAFLLIAACMALLFVLIMREASIYLATFFLPLGFAMLVWPATAKFVRRLTEFLIAMIFSKVIMVAAIAMGVAAVGATVGFDPVSSGGVVPDGGPVATPSENSAGQDLEDPADQSMLDWILTTSDAIMMLGIASFSPAMLNSVVGHVNIGGEMAGTVNQNLQRHTMVSVFNAADRGRTISGNVIGNANAPGVIGNASRLFRRPQPPPGGG